MEKNANYALVGLSTLILTVALIVFFAWLARLAIDREYDIYQIIFQGPVRGVSQGGEVHFNGIKVGEVKAIKLYDADTTKVVATVSITSDVPVRQDSYATLEPQGITGVSLVQITAGTQTNKLLKDVTPSGKVPTIASQRSALSDLLEGGGNAVARAIEALDRVNRVLSDENVKNFSATIQNIETVTAELRDRRALFANAEASLKNIDNAAQSFKALADSGKALIDSDGKRTLANLADAANEAKGAAADARKIMQALESPANEFASNGLPQLTGAIIQLQQAAEALERLVNDIQSSPQGALGKAPAQEMKVKP